MMDFDFRGKKGLLPRIDFNVESLMWGWFTYLCCFFLIDAFTATWADLAPVKTGMNFDRYSTAEINSFLDL